VVGVVDPEQADASIRTRLQPGALPAGVSVGQTWLGNVDARRVGYTLSRGAIAEDVDALVVLAASSSPSQAPVLDPKYRAELARRRELGNSTLPFRGGKIRFAEGVAAFASGADEPLQAVLRELQRDTGLRLLVKAFADQREAGALALSSRRAQLIVDWLTARGVGRDRLVARGCGAARPLNFGNTAAERAVNRRAELVRLTATAACEPPW
jgi:outer membrane protein OmpA-like peptidoglycan-associated protein